MATRVGVRDFGQHTSRWLREVEAGGEVTVTRRGRPVARLVPVREARGLKGMRAAGRLREPSGSLAEWLATYVPPSGSEATQRAIELRAEDGER